MGLAGDALADESLSCSGGTEEEKSFRWSPQPSKNVTVKNNILEQGNQPSISRRGEKREEKRNERSLHWPNNNLLDAFLGVLEASNITPINRGRSV